MHAYRNGHFVQMRPPPLALASIRGRNEILFSRQGRSYARTRIAAESTKHAPNSDGQENTHRTTNNAGKVSCQFFWVFVCLTHPCHGFIDRNVEKMTTGHRPSADAGGRDPFSRATGLHNLIPKREIHKRKAKALVLSGLEKGCNSFPGDGRFYVHNDGIYATTSKR